MTDSEIIDLICERVAVVLQIQGSQPDDDFLALGGDSLRGIELVLEIAQVVHVALEVEDVLRAQSLAEIAAIVRRKMNV